MHTVDLTGKTEQGIINIIANAGSTAAKWDAARKNVGHRSSMKYRVERDSERPGKMFNECDEQRKSKVDCKVSKYEQRFDKFMKIRTE